LCKSRPISANENDIIALVEIPSDESSDVWIETNQKVKSESNTQFSYTTNGTVLNSSTQKAIMDNASRYK
jgi:hypothetical protein